MAANSREICSEQATFASPWIQAASATPIQIQVMQARYTFHYAPQPNCRLNSDATAGHAFGIFMASRGALRTSCCGTG